MIDWSAWRTFGMGVLALAALIFAVWLKASDAAVKEIASASWLIVSALAARSAVSGLASGSGVKGAIAALTTDARPTDAKP
jgi:hypothetical protein